MHRWGRRMRTPARTLTSSPVPCMISRGMAKILLYIRTDLRLIFTKRTRKLVPPKSRARNFPFSVGERVKAASHHTCWDPCSAGHLGGEQRIKPSRRGASAPGLLDGRSFRSQQYPEPVLGQSSFLSPHFPKTQAPPIASEKQLFSWASFHVQREEPSRFS